MSESVKSVSLSSYQYFDGSNLTVLGGEDKLKIDNGYISGFAGIATDFNSDTMFVIDFKGGMTYDKKGILNQNLRIRNKVGENTQSTQIRYSPLSVNIPAGKSTDLYINPHYSGQYNYKTGKWTHSAGLFCGVTKKIKNFSISAEVQRYNLQTPKDNSPKNYSGNLIVSYNF